MGALDVVGIDFEHRLGIHAGRVCGTQVGIRLLGNGLLRPLANEHPAGKGTQCLTVEHVLIEFRALAVGHAVVDERVVVDVLLLVGHHTPEHPRLGILAAEGHVGAVARQSVVEGYAVQGCRGVALLVDIHVREATALDVRFLKLVQFEVGILAHKHLAHLGCQEIAVVDGMVAEEDFGLSSVLQHDEQATVDHQVNVGTQDIDNLQRALDDGVFGNVDEQSVLGEHRVQGIQPVLAAAGQAAITVLDELGVFCRSLGQRHHQDALGKGGRGESPVIETVVDDEVERCAQVGHVAAEYFIRIYGNVDVSEVQPIVGGKRLGNVGVLVALQLLRGESQAAEILAGLFARLVQQWGGMFINHPTALLVEFNILKSSFHHSLINWSKPLFSIIMATSGPPVWTILPPMSTCMMSGFR